jgi:histidine triad (HIT) family protein
MSDTIFGRILSGEIKSEFLYEDDQCIVINDVNPQAPVHILVIPRKPIPRLVDADDADQALLGHLLLVARNMAKELGIGEGFRLFINNGVDGGQTVFHLHVHVLGRQKMEEGSLGA